MVDIDDAVREVRNEVSRENLHITGEHYEIDAVFLEEFDLPALGVSLIRRGHLDLVERNAVEFGQPASAGMVADDQGNFAGELTGSVAIEQVRIAVEMLRDEDGHASGGGGELNPP